MTQKLPKKLPTYVNDMHKIADILEENEGVNYVLFMADAEESDNDSDRFFGGQMMHVATGKNGKATEPSVKTMLANLANAYLKNNDDMKYIEKLAWVRDLCSEMQHGLLEGEEGE